MALVRDYVLRAKSGPTPAIFLFNNISPCTAQEKIQAAVLAEDCKALVSQLEQLGFDEIYAVETDRNCLFQDDAVSQAMAEMLKRIDPSSVLIPATPTGPLRFFPEWLPALAAE